MKNFLHNFFIPSEQNDHTPHSLQKAAVVGMMGLVLLSFTVANIQSLVWITSEWMVSTILPAVVVAETNKERTFGQLTPLLRNQTLDVAAQLKADHMAKNEYFAHFSPEGVSPWHWFDMAAYTFIHAGENLAIHFTDSNDVVEAWMASPSHRANIMNGNYREIGIGTATGTYDGYPTVYVVQLFGAPAERIVTIADTVFPSVAFANVGDTEEDVVVVNESGAVLAVAGEQVTTSIIDEVSSGPIMLLEEEDIALSNDFPEVVSATDEVTIVTHSESIETVEIIEERVVVFSNHIATSTGGIPLQIDSISPGDTSLTTAPTLAFMTQPHKVLQTVYTIIGFFVALALMLSIIIEIRLQNPRQIGYGVGLIGVMFMLFYIHMSVSGGVLIV